MENSILKKKMTLLALSYVNGIGYFTLRKIYNQCSSFHSIWNYNFDNLLELFQVAKVKYADRLVNLFMNSKDECFKKAEKTYYQFENSRKIKFILDDEAEFPQRLLKIPDRPRWLFVQGNIQALHSKSIVAIIGTRHPTPKGLDIAKMLTKKLVSHGYVIVSGLAEGIDAAAHEATTWNGGMGIGVLGCGINIGFPAKTLKARHMILKKNGAVISEYMPNDSYSKYKFVWRDRLQSGLADSIIPVQGTLKSGTFHTIRFAEAQKKKIAGVYLSKIDENRQNELILHLKRKKYPVYDLAIDSEKLVNFLGNDRNGRPTQHTFKFIEPIANEKKVEKKKSLVKKVLNLIHKYKRK